MRIKLNSGYKLKTERGKTYFIESVMGEGASCLAYYATDEDTKEKVIIKEFYPVYISIERKDTGEILCSLNESEKFENRKERFNKSIDRQTELRSSEDNRNKIFGVYDRFEVNGTSYSVVLRNSGKTFEDIEDINLLNRIKICKSVAEHVKNCHKSGYLCLDIKPSNIFVMPETSDLAMFFDFDSFCKIEDISKQHVTSYTNNWAAPEQVIPSRRDSISAASDIFAIGELIYWAIFDSHSDSEKHRSHAFFNFNESKFSYLINDKAKKILIDIFHNTLRSSSRNRYQNIEELIVKIDNLLPELEYGKEWIRDAYPHVNEYFVGRSEEINGINKMLNTSHRVVVTGIGGIGKSEIVNHYIHLFKKDYTHIVYLTYMYDLVSTISKTEFIMGIEQAEEESDVYFCIRKIRKLSELITEDSLIVIDNLDVELEEIEYKDIWREIDSIKCDIIITSRCNQDQYSKQQVNVCALNDIQSKKLFYDYCQYDEAEEDAVNEIIKATQGHPLEIELIAKQTRVSSISPTDMRKKLENSGILGLGDEKIKWNLEKKTISDHIKGLFSVSSISRDQSKLLFKLAFMPVSGVKEEDFFDYFKLKNHNDLRYLIDNGWVREYEGNDKVLSVHPVISDIVTSEFQRNNDFLNELFSLENLNLRDNPYYLSNSISLRSCKYNLNNIVVADYIMRFYMFNKEYLLFEEKCKLLETAIIIYKGDYEEGEYVGIIEIAQANLCYLKLTEKNIEDTIKECKKHIKQAKKNKNSLCYCVWTSALIDIKSKRIILQNKQQMLAHISLWFNLCSVGLSLITNIKKIINANLRPWWGKMESLLETLNVMMSLESVVDAYKYNTLYFISPIHSVFETEWRMIYRLYKKIVLEIVDDENIFIPDWNNSELKFLLAKICLFINQYNEAISLIKEHIDDINKNNIKSHIALAKLYCILADCYVDMQKYEDALSNYESAIQVYSNLKMRSPIQLKIRVERVEILLQINNVKGESNTRLLNEIEEQDSYLKDYYKIQITINDILRHKSDGNVFKTNELIDDFNKQINNLMLSKFDNQMCIAQVLSIQGDMYSDEDNIAAAKGTYKRVYRIYKKYLGRKNAKTQFYLEKARA